MNKKVEQTIIRDVTVEDAGKRFDLLAADYFSLTRSASKKAIEEARIMVNGERIRPKDEAKAGDRLILTIEKKKTDKIDIPVLYEDEDILVVDKPSGISVHPAPGEKEITLTEIFEDRLGSVKDTERPGVVHRLDKGTSGVMILAKNTGSQTKLKAEFKKRNVKKVYNALVWGHILPREGVIDMPISRGTLLRQKFEIDKAGREAITEYKILKDYQDYSFLELQPRTGRTHQLRVHLSSLGYPIVGDKKYGRKNDPISRIFLHARKISFRHPKTKEQIAFESPLPLELEEFLAKSV